MKMQVLCVAIVASILSLSGMAHAAVVNVDFDGIRDDDGNGPADAIHYTGVGAVGTGEFHNSVVIDSRNGAGDAQSITTPTLSDEFTAATGVYLSFGPVGGDRNALYGGDTANLKNDYFFSTGNPSTLTIFGLAGPTADIYISNNNGTVAFGADTGVLVPGANSAGYRFYDDVPVVSGSVTATLTDTVVYGLTIDAPLAAVPEPTSLAFIGLIIPLAMRRR